MPKRKSSGTHELPAKVGKIDRVDLSLATTSNGSAPAIVSSHVAVAAPLNFAPAICLGMYPIEKTWPDIRSGLLHLIENVNHGFSIQEWMGLYKYVHAL